MTKCELNCLLCSKAVQILMSAFFWGTEPCKRESQRLSDCFMTDINEKLQHLNDCHFFFTFAFLKNKVKKVAICIKLDKI